VCSEYCTSAFRSIAAHALSDNDYDQLATDGRRKMTERTAYFLSAHSHCCEFDDGAIILDLASGTYVGVNAESLPDLRIRIQNWPNSRGIDGGATRKNAGSDKLIADLLRRGILTTSPTPECLLTAMNPLETLTITGSAAARRQVPIMDIPRFAMALLSTATRHKDKRLASLLDWLRQRQSLIRRHGHSATYDGVMMLLASFFRLRIWFYTADRRCLFDSLVLAVFLTRKNIPCTFVIGVSTKPFLAHSWVQMGAIVLNDTAEHVQTFTPILAIGESN
jgi:hypothetical protein